MNRLLACIGVLVFAIATATGCSDDEPAGSQTGTGAPSLATPVGTLAPTASVDVVQLTRTLDPIVQQSVNQGIATQADKQLFLGNLRAGPSGATRVGFFESASSGSLTIKTYPNEAAVTIDASNAQITRGPNTISLSDIRPRELLFVLVDPGTNRALNVKAFGVTAP